MVNGYFNCSYNELTSLKGCPREVGIHFNCSSNRLTSLEYCPKQINGNFNCSYNELTSFEYFPEELKGKHIYIENNNIKHAKLLNFNCKIYNAESIQSDFNSNGDVSEFLNKIPEKNNLK